MKYRSNSVLVLVPQNHFGEHMLKQATFLKEALGMRIFLINILQSASYFINRLSITRHKKRHQKKLDSFISFAQTVLESDLPKNTIPLIRYGPLIKTLIKESEVGGYEFVMLDKNTPNNAAGLSRTDIDRCVSKSFCPVLLTDHEKPVEKISKILVPIDISQRTTKRLYWATFFAKKFQATVKIVSALNIDIKETKSLAFKNAHKLKQMLESRGVHCEVEILKRANKELHSAILDFIEKDKPQLVIIRTHQESRFSGRRIGKFVSGIIHGSSVPVFTVGGVTKDWDVNAI